ncbi:hypothetical protein GCM10022268_02590 [Sphingomonas cynarae]|uniref:DUF885 domain-containing protein n=1 Tax=Sphingomonas cynarae TaxID=930197 RepID=A0ABP7CVI9_9SPHN
MIDRRALLAGIAATALPAFADSDDDRVRLALDAAAKAAPAEGLAMLAGLDPRGLAPGHRLDLLTARTGLAIDAGLATRPGDYGLRLRRTLGSADPRAARRRLDRALADLHARSARLFDRIGIAGDTIGARYVRLFAEADGLYTDTAAGRRQAVADMNRDLAIHRAAVARTIADVPPFCLDVTVRVLTPAEVAAGRQGYRTPPAPGRPGAYIVDLADIGRRPAWSLPSVVAHELLPGHMIQLGIEQTSPPHPLRATYAAAFVEGWATYAETLAAPDFRDPRTMLGHLHWLIFRAARGRIDLGIHAEGWSSGDARTRLAAWQGVPVYFATFDADLARIAKEPGTRAAEALAWLALADHAPRTAAARRRWHAAVLANGRKRLDALP